MAKLALAMFVDACGWEVLQDRSWFLDELTHRQSVGSLFGYSSACVPAILTGQLPNRSDHWSAFYYSPDTSPFRVLRPLRFLPRSIFDRGRVRRHLSKLIARAYGYTGYFQMYNLPFEALELYDYAEKHDIFVPGGVNKGKNIFDELARMGLPYHVSNWRHTEEQNIESLERALGRGESAFAFLYTAKLDALLHDHTRFSPLVDVKLRWYEQHVRELFRLAAKNYSDVRIALFSDHGMCTVRRVVDLMPRIEQLPLQHGKDYAAVYDSTMMRFWFLRPGAEAMIRSVLPDGEDGRFVTDDEHRNLGTYWPNHKFGHAIFLLNPGLLLNPSHMGKVPMKGMHGYHPDDPDSNAALLANFSPRTEVHKITDLYWVMREMADWAAA